MEIFNECKAIRERVLGKEHPDFAGMLGNMAGCLWGQGKHEEAMRLYHESLGIYERTVGKSHPDYASILLNTASCLAELGRQS